MNDGRILQIGGFDGFFWAGASATADCEIYDPANPAAGWVECAPIGTVHGEGIPQPHAMFWAATLPSGNVLVAGGFSRGGEIGPFTSWVYRPDADAWVGITASDGPPQQLVNPHSIMSPMILDDGSALIAGGGYVDPDGLGFSDASYRFFEDADEPANGHWERTGDLPYTAVSAGVAKLADGRVLFAGGLEDVRFGSYITSAQAAVYDLASESWTAVEDMPSCGTTDDMAEFSPQFAYGGPDTAWPVRDVNPGSRWHPAIAALPDGDAIVAGGSTWGAIETEWWSYGRNSAVRFDGATGTWTEIEATKNWHAYARAVTLPDGRVLLNGGFYDRSMAESLDPSTGHWHNAGGFVSDPPCVNGKAYRWKDAERCFSLDEYGGQLRVLGDGGVLQTCGFDYSRPFPQMSCDRAFVWYARPADP